MTLTAQSGILVPVPEAESVVGPLRARLDRAAGWGVPPHVTVLYPFVPPQEISTAVIEAAARAVASVPAFSCEFARTCWFGEDVVWLAPDPVAAFRELTSAVHAAFPRFPPYSGEYADVTPHLTIGARPHGSADALRAAEAAVRPALPVRTFVKCAWLMTGTQAPGSWRAIAELPLGT
jgi:2'-5' RNA ligase